MRQEKWPFFHRRPNPLVEQVGIAVSASEPCERSPRREHQGDLAAKALHCGVVVDLRFDSVRETQSPQARTKQVAEDIQVRKRFALSSLLSWAGKTKAVSRG